MATYKKIIITYLIAVAFGSATIPVCCAQATMSESTKLQLDNPASIFANEPNFSAQTDDNLSTRELFYKMISAVLLVVFLGVAAIYISKKFMPRITNLASKKIQLLETIHLGPRKAIHLIEIGSQQILIGSTNENITRLADVTNALIDSSSQKIENN